MKLKREAGHKTKHECVAGKKRKKMLFLKFLFQKIKPRLISHKYLGREGQRDRWGLGPYLLFSFTLYCKSKGDG